MRRESAFRSHRLAAQPAPAAFERGRATTHDFRERIATALVVLVLSASVYLGLSNADDVLNTITVWQRLVGVTATMYGLTAIVALYALWGRRSWLVRCLLIWAVLVVFTATLAAAAYGQALGSSLLVALVSAAIVTPVVLYGRRRVRGWAGLAAREGPAA